MSISGTEKKRARPRPLKTLAAYLALSALAALVGWVYGLFAHGVRAAAMTWMFGWPLAGGALFALVCLLPPVSRGPAGFRLFSNLYHSGVAALTVGSLLRGILDIAGTGSPYTAAFSVAGAAFLAASLAALAVGVFRRAEK